MQRRVRRQIEKREEPPLSPPPLKIEILVGISAGFFAENQAACLTGLSAEDGNEVFNAI